MPPSLATQKTLRQQYRALRQQLSEIQQEHAARALLANCMQLPVMQDATYIACYLSNDGEINPTYLIEWCWQQGKTVLLPIIDPVQEGHLVFMPYHATSLMVINQYGIAEPQYEPAEAADIHSIDIIFTPLVAFDSLGNRLGMGGGYYDRTLASLAAHPNSTHVLGLAHACQHSSALPVQKWDFPLQGIITDRQIFSFS
jgi:5-formyltetrahydrofolate cyclo-ligase